MESEMFGEFSEGQTKVTSDPVSGRAIMLPELLSTNNVEESTKAPFFPPSPLINFIPYKSDGCVWNGVELLNTNAKSAQFVSENCYEFGCHCFGIQHLFSFKGIEISVLNEKEEESERRNLKAIENDKNELYILLDVDRKKLSAYTLNEKLLFEIDFTAARCRILIGIKEVGNLLTINPYSFFGEENFFIKLLNTHSTKLTLKKVAQWSFILNFCLDNYAKDVEDFLRAELKSPEGQDFTATEYIYDEKLKILAVKRQGYKHKALQAVNKLALTAAKNIITPELSCVKGTESGYEFYLKYKLSLLSDKATTTPQEIIRAKDRILTTLANFKPCSQAPSSALTIKYVASIDGLVVFDQQNTFKIIYERDEQKEFIISPYLFETQHITAYFSEEELISFFKNIKWEMIGALSTPHENLLTLRALEKIESSFVKVANRIFFVCPEDLYEHIIRCLMVAFKSSGYKDNESARHMPAINNEDIDFNLFFQEAVEDSSNKGTQLLADKESFNLSLPMEDDVAKNVLLRLEEALYQQSAQYQRNLNFSSRPHTSYYRLSSFTSLAAEYHVIKRWLDIGCYYKSQTQDLYTFYNKDTLLFRGSVLLNPPTEEQLLLNKAIIMRDCVPLDFSLSHQRPHVSACKILHLELLSSDMLLGVLDRTLSFKLYSIAFGVVELYRIQLDKQIQLDESPFSFSCLLASTKPNIGYFSPQGRFKYESEGLPKCEDNLKLESSDVEKGKFERLCKLGFNAELCKKALLEIGDEVSEEGVNVVLSYINQPPTAEIFNYSSKYLYSQNTKALQPSIVQKEENLEGMYFDKKPFAEIEIGPMGLETAKSTQNAFLATTDTITHIGGFFTSKSGSMPTFMVLVFFTNGSNQDRVLGLQLDYTAPLLRKVLIVDGNGECPSSTWLGKVYLRRGGEEAELASVLSERFFLQAHTILPLMYRKDFFCASHAEIVSLPAGLVPQKLIYNTMLNSNSDKNSILLFNSKALGRLSIICSAPSQSKRVYEIKIHELIDFLTAHSLEVSKMGLFVYDQESIRKVHPEDFTLEEVLKTPNKRIRRVIPLLYDNLLVIYQHSRELLFSDLALQAAQFELPAESFSVQSLTLSPQKLLSALRNNRNCPVIVLNHKNIALQHKATAASNVLLHIPDRSLEAMIQVKPTISVRTLMVSLQLFVVLPPQQHSVVREMQDFASLSDNIQAFDPCFTKSLPLIALSSNIVGFFENMPLANALLPDDEPFTHPHCGEVFTLENTFMKHMEIQRINFSLNEASFNEGAVSDVLFFVLSDFHLVGELRRYSSLTINEYAELWRHNNIDNELKPIAHADLQTIGRSSFTIQLSQPVLGCYIAFMAMSRTTTPAGVLSVDFFSVEGNYVDKAQNHPSEMHNNLTIAPTSITSLLPVITLNGKELVKDLHMFRTTECGSKGLITLVTSMTTELDYEDISVCISPLSSQSPLYAVNVAFSHCDIGYAVSLHHDILKGDTEQVHKVVVSFYKSIEESAHYAEEYINDFINLLQHLQVLYTPTIIDHLCNYIDWNGSILHQLLSSCKPALNKLLYKIISKAGADNMACSLSKETLEQLKIDELNQLPVENQKIIWLLARNSSHQGGMKVVVQHFFTTLFLYTLKQIETLYIFEEKALQLMGVEAINPKGQLLTSSLVSSLQTFTSVFALIKPSGHSFCVREPTYHDYYIPFERNFTISEISLSIGEKMGVEPFTLSLFSLNSNQHFELVLSKVFDSNFCLQATKSALQGKPFTCALDLTQCGFVTNVLRIQISFNHLSSFRYTNRSLIEPFRLNFYGTPMDELPFPKNIGFITLLRSTYEENLGEKCKISQILTLPESPNDQKPSPIIEPSQELNREQAMETLQQLCKLLYRGLSRLDPSELAPHSSSLVCLKPLIDQRASLLKQLTTSSYKVSTDSKFLNIFVAEMTEFIATVLNGSYGAEFISFISSEERTEIAWHLIYHFPLFEGLSVGPVKTFRTRLIHSMTPGEHNLLLEKLISSFLREKDAIFIAALHRFSSLLLNAGILALDWQNQAENIVNNWLEAKSDPEWKQLLVRFALLAQTLEASLPERVQPLSADNSARLLLFIVNSRLDLTSPKMSILVHKLVKSFSIAQFMEGDNFHSLREVILGLEKIGLLSNLKSSFEEQITELRLSIRQAAPPIAILKLRSALKIATQFKNILHDLIVFPGAEERLSLIEFCLYTLVDFCSLLIPQLHGKNYNVSLVSPPLFNRPLLVEFFTFCSKPHINSERLLCKISQLVAHEEVGAQILGLLLDMYAEASDERQELLAECIIEKVAKIFSPTKNKTSLYEHATHIVEFVIKILGKKEKNLRTRPQVIDFCSQLCLYPINVAGSLVYSEAPCAVEFKEHIFLPLFSVVFKFMAKELNFGGADNFLYLEQNIILVLELCSHLTFILLKGLNRHKKPLIDEFLNQFQSNMTEEERVLTREALRNLLAWLMLNSNIALSDQPTPAGNLLKQLFNNSWRLFRLFFNNSIISSEVIDAICFHLQCVYASLSRKAIHDEGQGFMSLLLADNVSEFLGSLIEELSSNQILLSRFLNKNRGLEFIFEVLGRWLGLSLPALKAPGTIIDRIHRYVMKKRVTENQHQLPPPANVRDKNIFETELGNRIQLFFDDKSFISPLICDWQTNKKGVDKALYSTVFPFNKKQLRLRLRLAAPTHVRNIKIGFYLQRWEKQLSLGQPSYVRLNLLLDEKSQRHPLGELRRIEDAGYASCLTTVYALSFGRLHGEYMPAIAQLVDHLPFWDLELVIGRPIVSVVDKISPIYPRCTGPTNLAISFISLEGFPPSKVDIERGFQTTLRKTFYRAIEFLFDNETSVETLEVFFDTLPAPDRKALFELIQRQLEGLVDNFTLKLSKFFLMVTSKEASLSKPLFFILLHRLDSNEHFFSLIEALIKSSASHELLLQFVSHCIIQIMDDVDINSRCFEVISNCLIETCNTKPDCSIAFPLTVEFYSKLLDLLASKPRDFPLLRILAILPCLFFEQTIYVPQQLMHQSYFIDKASASGSLELAGSLLEIIDARLRNKNYYLLPLAATIATRSLSAFDLINKDNIIRCVADASCTLTEDSFYARRALQIFSTIPIYLEQLNALDINEKLCHTIETHLLTPNWHTQAELTTSLLKSLFSISFFNQKTLNSTEQRLFALLKNCGLSKNLVECFLQPLFAMEHTKDVQFKFVPTVTHKEAEIRNISAAKSQLLFTFDSNYLNDMQKGELEKVGQLNISDSIKKVLSSNKWTKATEGSFMADNYSADLYHFLVTTSPVLLIANCVKDMDNTQIPFIIFSPAGFKAETPGIAYTDSSSSSFFCVIDGEASVVFRSSAQGNPRGFEFNDKNKQFKAIFAYHQDKKAMIFPLERELCQHNELDVIWPADCSWPKERYQDDLCFKSFELFVLESQHMATHHQRASSFYYEKINQLPADDNLLAATPSIFSALTVFSLPLALTPRALQTSLKATVKSERMDACLGDFSEKLVTLDCSKPIFTIQAPQLEGNYTPIRPLFNVFIQKGGLSFFINAILSENMEEAFSLPNSAATHLRQTLLEVLRMKRFPQLFETLAANKEFYTLLFALLTHTAPNGQDWTQVATSVKAFLVEKLKDLLALGEEGTWTCSRELDVLGFALGFLADLSAEPRRTKTNDHKREESLAPPRVEPSDRDPVKRKGIGYDKENSGQSWIISDYLTKLKRKNDNIVSVVGLIRLIIEKDDEGISAEQLRQSCLLPLLENSFKNNSLQDISKEAELYLSLYELTLVLAKNKGLGCLLDSLSEEYVPRQLLSVKEVLALQQESLLIFKSFANAADNGKTPLLDLADKVIQLSNEIRALCYKEGSSDIHHPTSQDIPAIEGLEVNQRYKIALEKLRFGLANMKKDGKYVHFYADSLEESNTAFSAGRSLRLAQEVTMLTTSLPSDSFNAIYVRCDLTRLDLLKGLIAGAEGTPYAHGLFEYHILLPPGYPFVPPKCTFQTTGGSDVRFNPNLYNCGKVCLSLLGTWRGHASENWDAKISNILQLLLSLQSIVMSEEVYFNEPGFEHEIGTEGGESKNEAYSNIIRLCNIKYAMIGQIRSPPPGFEHVVRRHFYIKREVILKECAEWVRRSQVCKATYTELVLDHNHSYALRFNNDPSAYARELTTEICNLENALKELALSSDPRDIYLPVQAADTVNEKVKPAPPTLSSKIHHADEKVDVGYEAEMAEEVFDVNVGKVTNRWSRYIGVMGLDAIRKQSNTSVLLVGLNAVGLETAKNLTLSGFKRIVVADWQTLAPVDLPSVFYAEHSHIGINRAAAVLQKLRQLNPFVRIEAKELQEEEKWQFADSFDVIVICQHFPPITDSLLAKARSTQKKVIVAEAYGVCARIFCDFGDEFVVSDVDGEEPAEVYCEGVDYETNVLLLAPKSYHGFKVGDTVQLFITTLTESAHPQHPQGLSLTLREPLTHLEVGVEENLREIEIPQGRGKIREVKKPLHLKFQPFANDSDNITDPALNPCDFTKIESSQEVALCFRFKQTYERSYLVPFSIPHATNFQEHLAVFAEAEHNKLLRTFILLGFSCVPSLAAFIGGLAAQEVIKGVTGKYKPINQSFYYDCRELLSSSSKELTWEEMGQKHQDLHVAIGENSEGYLMELLGKDLFDRLQNSNAFIIGAGAIGCELLKNLAQWGIGSGAGKLTVSDPDSIELSNLSRQFLFREKHISQLKAVVAARTVETLHPRYPPSHIQALALRVGPQSEDTFSNSFFTAQALCLNALDNIPARLYVDQRCVANSIPLLESGTLGPKGHVQVIVPFITENYSAVRDPQEETSIPLCTMKMFPEEINHCIEWAKDKLEDLFTQRPRSLQRTIEEWRRGELNALEPKMLRQSLRFLKRRPQNCLDCVVEARRLFQKYFSNNVQQLLSVYPPTSRGKDGRPFWELPRRLPSPLTFDTTNSTHVSAISSTAILFARIWGISLDGFASIDIPAAANKTPIGPFVTKDSKAKTMRAMLQKESGEKPEGDGDEGEILPVTSLLDEWQCILPTLDVEALLASLNEEVFEKDDDTNGQIDFIAAFTNLRASNYSLPETDWITAKIRAGRITPALPTTTSIVAALQTIEAIKVLMTGPIELYRNSFLNIAVPMIAMAEPGPAARHSLTPELSVSVWDRWHYTFKDGGSDQLSDLFAWIYETYHLRAMALMRGADTIFMRLLHNWMEFKDNKLSSLLGLSPGDSVQTELVCHREGEDSPIAHIPPLLIEYMPK